MSKKPFSLVITPVVVPFNCTVAKPTAYFSSSRAYPRTKIFCAPSVHRQKAKRRYVIMRLYIEIVYISFNNMTIIYLNVDNGFLFHAFLILAIRSSKTFLPNSSKSTSALYSGSSFVILVIVPRPNLS